MKIALIQINPVIGDFAKNCSKIVRYARRAAESGCRLAIFPELAVSGYPPLDLLERSSFVKDQEAAVVRLVADLPSIYVMFGCFERRTESVGKPLYNTACVARDGKIVHKTRKQLLPEYDVFDENRYFEPGDPAEPFSCEGLIIGVTVCEDIWHYQVHDYSGRPLENLFGHARSRGSRIDLIVRAEKIVFLTAVLPR